MQHIATPHNTLQHRTTRCNTTPRIEEDEALAAWRRSAHARRYCAPATGTSGSMRTSLMLASSLRVFLTAVASPLARRAMFEHVHASSVAASHRSHRHGCRQWHGRVHVLLRSVSLSLYSSISLVLTSSKAASHTFDSRSTGESVPSAHSQRSAGLPLCKYSRRIGRCASSSSPPICDGGACVSACLLAHRARQRHRSADRRSCALYDLFDDTRVSRVSRVSRTRSWSMLCAVRVLQCAVLWCCSAL